MRLKKNVKRNKEIPMDGTKRAILDNGRSDIAASLGMTFIVGFASTSEWNSINCCCVYETKLRFPKSEAVSKLNEILNIIGMKMKIILEIYLYLNQMSEILTFIPGKFNLTRKEGMQGSPGKKRKQMHIYNTCEENFALWFARPKIEARGATGFRFGILGKIRRGPGIFEYMQKISQDN